MSWRGLLNIVINIFTVRAFLECMLEQVQIERTPTNDNLTWEEALKPNKVQCTM